MNIRRRCLSCNKKKLREIINLGLHSFADRFVPKKKTKSSDPAYPLILDYCLECNFIQSRFITNPRDRYSLIDYSYTSSNSSFARNHWDKFALDLDKKYKIKKKKILEIGSNDGYLCKRLNEKGANTLGIDASSFMTSLARRKKVNSLNLIFSYKESIKIKKKFGEFDIIIANNVFNHSDNPAEFIKGVRNLLIKDGLYIFEQPDFAKGAVTLKFDQIYHEHVSYFTAKNINNFLRINKMKLIEIKENNYHGGSLRSIAVKDTSENHKIRINLSKFKKYSKIYKVGFFKKMMRLIEKKREIFIKKINSFKNSGYTICGIGAGAKSNTFLTFYSLDNSIVKFLTDSSKFKYNKYTPLTRIIIKNDKEIKKYDKIVGMILSWNISDIVLKKIKKINKKIKIIHT